MAIAIIAGISSRFPHHSIIVVTNLLTSLLGTTQ